jgi:predicted O-linked N-acetylglucosamine transferase (SPINDLY family)
MSINRKQRRADKSRAKSAASPVQGLFSEALLHHEAGRLDDAVALYKRALALKPDYVEACNNLGVALQTQGRIEEAVAQYRRTLELRPNSAEAHINLGNLCMEQRNFDEAAVHFERALVLKPDAAEAWSNLGNVLREQGRLDDAVTRYKRALALRPDYAEAWNNLGSALHTQGKPDEAVRQYERAIALNPGLADAHNNCGNAFQVQGKLIEAIAQYERAIALNPAFSDAHNNLGKLLHEQGRFDDAKTHYERALTLRPDCAEFLNNLGTVFVTQNKFDEAVPFFERALALNPDPVETLNNLGGMFFVQGKSEDAIACYRQALAVKPNSGKTYDNLLRIMVHTASVSPAELAATAREYGERLADPLRRQRPLIRDRNPDRRLRIGYVSPDFRNHVVNYFFESLLKLHDRQQFEVFAYSSALREDTVTARLKQEFDHWRGIQFQNDDQVADLIEADKIDILIDLAGHTGNNSLLVFARKPAPVQVTWLGYPATTGMTAIDYRITDIHAEPVGMTENLNTETLWRLPEIFCCYQAHENSPAVIDHPPFEDNGYVTFGCFNNFSKVTAPVLETWGQILARVPNSRLLLEISGLESPRFRAGIEARLQRFALPFDQLILVPRKRSNQFVLYNRIDIALDPFPCNGGTTSMDTMWMGVPFVTLAGDHFVSRMGVTILTNAGIPELIAKDREEYVSLAVNLALDKERLRSLRHNLRQKVVASPLMNQPTFVHNMEAAYREMWRKWCAEQSEMKSVSENTVR